MLASHALSEFEVVEFRSSLCTDATVGKMPVPTACEGVRPAGETGSHSEAKLEGIRCVRGSLVAFCLEAAMALCVYGIWEAWHSLR
jgi:hypothetical protein